ncbi:putative isopenicillin N epimerase [Parvularcula bermudensis HTCC2503]|uniref:Putative isopenicillin N epimerase n=1 Tax=Parvularcula bermudensis (strain ATCC BAA-594 / HTCC2503 / KCTC 12087) TaxID=314260 RepID=E0TC82_PARBH|nr:aminotransferase class V-fold PLP-dependent enzyme [Parvularcula bermudensis]ADM08515.1 putative isopenicillin N epimerase [Parvularcula bermudensis HTCC2503]
MVSMTRRRLVSAGVAATATASSGASFAATSASLLHTGPLGSPTGPDDETFWSAIATQYDMTDRVTNLENGNWGVMARPVLDAYKAHTERVNRENSYFARRQFGPIYRDIVTQTAAQLRVEPTELALTRGASEALLALIGGYRPLTKGHSVMYADLDYGSMQAAMRALARRQGAEVVELALPEPATYEGLIATYEAAFEAHPRTKLLLLTHISHRTGLMLPVAEITERAQARGIDVIVDAAHSWGQVDFQLPDLKADFIGVNLHKWIGAPIGVGALYIAKDRLDDIAPDIGAHEEEFDRIEGRVHTGTANYAAFMTVPDAFAFHRKVGPAAKEARFRYLRDLWAEACRPIPGVTILTPNEPRLHGGITAFRIEGRTSTEDNQRIAAFLLDEYGVFSVHRTGVARGACVRLTPTAYTTPLDMTLAIDAVTAAAAAFR